MGFTGIDTKMQSMLTFSNDTNPSALSRKVKMKNHGEGTGLKD